jgi:predicted ATP-binding protein involved in virulence
MKVSVVFDTVLQQLDSAAVGIAFRYISLNKQISKEVETKAEGILIQNEIAGDDRKR